MMICLSMYDSVDGFPDDPAKSVRAINELLMLGCARKGQSIPGMVLDLTTKDPNKSKP